MKKYFQVITGSIILGVTLLSVLVSPVLAATTPSASNTANNGQALEIAPPVIYLTVNPGQTVNTTIYIRDVSNGNLVVTGQANDFVAAGDDGTPKILLDNSDTSDPYSMKAWVDPPASLLLVPHEIKTMSLTLHVPANASPGGHYGIVRFTGTPPSLANSGVSLSASLGALMLVTVTGKITEQVSVQKFSVNHQGHTASLFESGPLDFVELFKNVGNVHEQPTGQVSITDTFGKKLASLNVNVPPKNILPASSRKFDEPLDSTVIGNKLLFGRYTAKMKVTYGASKQVLTATLVLWVIPYRLVLLIIALLIAAFFLLRYLIRRYNRFILNRASGGTKRKR